MKIVVQHHSTQENVIKKLDQASDKLMTIEIKNVRIEDQKREWNGPVMSFSLTAKLGFISVPLAGTMAVDDASVTMECELPPLVKNFLSEEKFRAIMENNVRALVS